MTQQQIFEMPHLNSNNSHKLKAKVLLAEDDANTAFMLKQNLQQSGYKVTHALDGQQAVIALNTHTFDIALLDIMMPKKDGLELTEFIKSRYKNLPVVLLTARNLLEDRVKGFKTGCDDYVSKPFYYEELELRLEAVLRRNKPQKEASKFYNIKGVHFDFRENTVKSKSHEVLLTPTESKIMAVFVEQFDRTVSRDLLLEKVWGVSNTYTSRSFDVYLNRIRKIIKPFLVFEIENTHGLGYKMKPLK